MRKSGRAVCRLHDYPPAMGRCATVRALAGGTFSRPQREGAAADPAFAGKPDEQFAMAHAHDGRRDFRRANRFVIQNWLSSRRHRRPAGAFVQIISPINDSATPFWLTLTSATHESRGAVSSWICVRFDRPMSARLSDYDYVLPRELIAQRPLVRREDSRLMVLHRAEHRIEHRQFGELRTFLQPGDLVVLNDTRVLAARRFSDDGERIVTFEKDVDVYAGGFMPLPPYVNRRSDESDGARYQTVFAREA